MIFNQVKRTIVKDRLRFFFYEIAIAFILIFIASAIEYNFLPFELNPILFGLIFYVIRVIIVVFAVPLTIWLMRKLISPANSDLEDNTKFSAFKSHFMLYKVSKNNYKYQLLYGILLLFLVFIPLNFFLYLLIPEMLVYRSYSLGFILQNSYLFIDNYIIFFVLLVIIQSSIAIAEETIYRGFVNKRGSERFDKISAVLISAYFYGFLGLLFYLEPFSISFGIWYPFVWFIPLFFTGLVLSLTTIRRKWLFPSIFAHSINNIIMISIIWYFLNGGNFMEIILFTFLPLLGVSLVLLLWQRNRIRESLSIGIEMLKSYLKNNEKEDERTNDKYFRIFFDFIMGLLVFLIGLLIII